MRFAAACTFAVAGLAGASATDSDLDGFEDPQDNCEEAKNGLGDPEPLRQRDTDLDGFGNACDPDFDNDGLAGTRDFGMLWNAFGSRIGEQNYAPAADMNGDGVVGTLDFSLFSRSFGDPPGPSGLACAGTAPCPRQNVLVLIADDVGLDKVGIYRDRFPTAPGDPPHLPPDTPQLDSLAAAGVRFEHAWTNPLCSASRAAALTGLHAFRTGIGGVLRVGDLSSDRLDPAAPSVARLFAAAGYRTAAFGKWHLSSFCKAHRTLDGGCAEDDPGTAEVEGYDLDHPLEMGFGYFEGTSNFRDYCDWPKVRLTRAPDGSTIVLENAGSTVYATTDLVNGAIAWIQEASRPTEEDPSPRWLAWVGFNAAHNPLHRADASDPCPMTSEGASARELYDSMVERLDEEIGRLLAAIPPKVRSHTLVVFFGDNGTNREGVAPPLDPLHAKGSLYQGGVNVPLIVRGRMLTVRPGGESISAPVDLTDLFATLASLAGLPPPPEIAKDSQSFAAQLVNPGIATTRASAYAERFEPDGPGPYSSDLRAIRDDRYKLIRAEHVGFEAFDLWQDDPFELDDLIPAASGEQRDRLFCLASRMSDLRGEAWSFDDFDGDGVPNVADNCSVEANPTQCNTNSLRSCPAGSLPDALGNHCDADFNCDGSADEVDQSLFRTAEGSRVGDSGYDPDIDMNCDGSIDSLDESLLLYAKVGPAGCGAVVPCPADAPQGCP